MTLHIEPIEFSLVVLGTWRVTHLLVAEDGPWDVVIRIRARLGNSMLGQAMDCFYCLSLWVSAVFATLVADGPLEWLLVWLATSAAACLLERSTQDRSDTTNPVSPPERTTPWHAVDNDGSS
jgi:Protein of unknown function (DUF1360)